MRHKKVVPYIIAFIMVWAVSLLTGLGAANILLLPLYGAFVVFIKASDRYTGEERFISAGILSAIFSLLYVFYKAESLAAEYDNKLFKVIVIAIVFLGLYGIFYYSIKAVEVFYRNRDFFVNDEKSPDSLKNDRSVIIFVLSLLAMILCYIPIYLYEYPGILTPDSIGQIEQAIGVHPYSNHHPMAHTFLIGSCIKAASAFGGSLESGVALYTFFQMLMMALIYSYTIMTLYQMKVKKVFLWLTFAFYALLPFQAVFAVSMWKDIFFAGFVLLFAVSFLRLLHAGRAVRSVSFVRDLIIQCVAFAGINLFRSNGRYAMIVMLPILLIWGIVKIVSRRGRSALIVTLMSAWIIATLLVIPVRYYFIPNANGDGVETPGPDTVENLAIPLQLFARVIYDGKELSAESRELADSMMDTSLIGSLYVPGFADNIKELVRAGHPEVLTEKRSECIHAFIETGLKYPGEYFLAYRDMTCGYWFPDNPKDANGYTVAFGEGICDNPLGLAQRWLISGIPAKLVIKVKEIALKMGDMMPGYSFFFCMGGAFYLLLLSLVLCVKNKGNRDKALILLMPLLIMGTVLIATPVSNDFRYSYFLTDLIPIMALLPVRSDIH
ncbi:MAG: DUF6020 family protein [Lachnospiraceae bacterium]|nr:DUF6020 family protein [Lachnospiraceae bacterium]